jgi:hypothetical protein
VHGGGAEDSAKSPNQPALRSDPAPATPVTAPSAAIASAQAPSATDTSPRAQVSGTEPLSSAASLTAAAALSTLRNAGDGSSSPSAEAPPPARSLPTTEASSGIVQSARVVEAMGSSEMHIDMRTQAFGDVEVHTVLRESQLGVSVGSERGDLKSFLVSEVPVLQSVAQQHDLRLETLRFLDSGSQSGATFAGNGGQQSQAQNGGQSMQQGVVAGDAALSDPWSSEPWSSEPLPDDIIALPTAGLSVHA